MKKQSVKHGLRYRFTLKSFGDDWYTRECSLIFLFGKGLRRYLMSSRANANLQNNRDIHTPDANATILYSTQKTTLRDYAMYAAMLRCKT